GAAAPPGHPPDQAVFLQHRQRLPQRRPADPQVVRERALGAEPLARAQPPGRDLVGEHPADVVGRLRVRLAHHLPTVPHPPTASSDSGRTWPPSTTIVCPVMYPASSLARNSAAWPMSATVPSRRSG